MPIFTRLRSTYFAILICVYFVVLAVGYARAMPPFEAADEAAHFLYAHNLLEDRALPTINSREEVAAQATPTDQWAIESHQPPLYYVLGALLISPFNRDDINAYLRPNNVIFSRGVTANNHNKWLHPPADFDGSTPDAVWIFRLYSIALGAGTLWFIYRAARLLTAGPLVPLGAMLLVASMPTFVSISASINNDNGVTFLYAVGVYLCLCLWRERAISRRNLLALSAVLSLIALTKLTGASLFGIVFITLAVGVWRGYWPGRQAIYNAGMMLLSAAIIAGWWYLRNWSLYGDPLALGATRSLWGREFEIAATSGDALAELQRIAQSFWMMFGHLHLPVYGPDWVYGYAAVITLIGVIGLAVQATKANQTGLQRDSMMLLSVVCVLIMAMLLIGTRSVDISYGRLLFPALVGFAPLMLLGWQQVLRAFAPVLLLPLLWITLVTPNAIIATAYPTLSVMDSDTVVPNAINATVGDTLTLAGYDIQQAAIKPGDDLTIEVYLRGEHAENPLLALTVVDPLTTERLGYAEVYPGVAPMDVLKAGALYRARVTFPLEAISDNDGLSPRQLRLRLDWIPPNATEPLPWVDGSGNRLDDLFITGPVLDDPAYAPNIPTTPLSVTFRAEKAESMETLNLAGYGLPQQIVAPGDSLPVNLQWDGGEMTEDWTLTVQLLGPDGRLITQSDGPIPGYPTSVWLPGRSFTSAQMLNLPADVPPGDYQIALGWYRQVDGAFTRMALLDQLDLDGLLVLPAPITVE